MNRHLMHRAFHHQRSGFDKVISTLGKVAYGTSLIAGTLGLAKHTVDVLSGKAPPLFAGIYSWRTNCWNRFINRCNYRSAPMLAMLHHRTHRHY